jgi:hypothetical protein
VELSTASVLFRSSPWFSLSKLGSPLDRVFSWFAAVAGGSCPARCSGRCRKVAAAYQLRGPVASLPNGVAPAGNTYISPLLRESIARPCQLAAFVRVALNAYSPEAPCLRVRRIAGPNFGLSELIDSAPFDPAVTFPGQSAVVRCLRN